MRLASFVVIVIGLAASSFAQPDSQPASRPTPPAEYQPVADEPVISARAVDERNKLIGPFLIRYVLRQIDLTDEQHKLAMDLMNTVYREAENQVDEQELAIQAQQIQKLRAEGKMAEADALEEMMRHSIPNPRREFFASITEHLTDEQKAKLEAARERIEANPSGALRPVDVFRAAQSLDLSPEQQEQLHQIKESFRRHISAAGKFDLPAKRQFMQRLLARIYDKVLTPAQRKQMDALLEPLRTDLLPGIERMDRRYREERNRIRKTAGRPQVKPDQP
ncbi:MAG: hypothetical protein D6744_17025 [Planctomycetota bacterium]|nr:MAG: hypothetical protein D6744_17025 [Planctomycetota bacterium]